MVHGLPNQASKILKDVEMCQTIKVQVWKKREEWFGMIIALIPAADCEERQTIL